MVRTLHMHVPTNAVHTPPTRACVCLHPYARAREENTNRIETRRCFHRQTPCPVQTSWVSAVSTCHTRIVPRSWITVWPPTSFIRRCSGLELLPHRCMVSSPRGVGRLLLWGKPLFCLLLPFASLAISYSPSPARPPLGFINLTLT